MTDNIWLKKAKEYKLHLTMYDDRSDTEAKQKNVVPYSCCDKSHEVMKPCMVFLWSKIFAKNFAS